MAWRDRLKTIVITAVLTSAAWLVVGIVFLAKPRGAPPQQAAMLAAVDVRADGRLRVPVQGVQREALVDTWGQSREGGRRAHEAIDIMAPRGTPVLAAAPGTVEKLFVSVRGGNTVYIRSPDRRTTYYYAHLDSYAPRLAERQSVRAGQVIGFVGSTGDASPAAPHLHFGINQVRSDEGWWQGVAVNPYPLLRR